MLAIDTGILVVVRDALLAVALESRTRYYVAKLPVTSCNANAIPSCSCELRRSCWARVKASSWSPISTERCRLTFLPQDEFTDHP